MNAMLHAPPALVGGLTPAEASRLFAIAPLVRAMFRGPMPEQRTKLMRMLSLLVQRLDAPIELSQALSGLGDRHRAYGVMAQDFEPVGRALLGTLDARVGIEVLAQARVAWRKLYAFVTAQMSAPALP